MDKVLIADDDAQLLLILSETLKKYGKGYDIVTASDGLAAIKALQKERFSLVVTDIQMPRVNGLVLLSYMSKNFPKIPCIVMTGHGTPDLKRRLERESLHYLEKPFQIQQLAEAIMSVLGRQESLGGTLNGVSLHGFLKLIEMEHITCLCEINSPDGNKGYLFFDGGILHNAFYGDLRGEGAAVKLLNMDGVTIKFRKPPEKKIPRRIIRKLSALITEVAAVPPG
jgi:CheY-like chemotaxis protein